MWSTVLPREEALIHFNLAPFTMRRDIALLCSLHRSAIQRGPPQFRELFKRMPGSLRLVDPLKERKASPMLQRSIWGLARVYNTLGGTLQCSDVKGFQILLQVSRDDEETLFGMAHAVLAEMSSSFEKRC